MKKILSLLMLFTMLIMLSACEFETDVNHSELPANSSVKTQSEQSQQIQETELAKQEDVTKPISSNASSDNGSSKNLSVISSSNASVKTTVIKVSSSKPTSSKSSSSTAVKTQVGGNSVTVPDHSETVGNLVWVPTRGGTKYHSKSSCSKMIDPIQVSKETAIANGYTPCGRCYK